MNYLISAVVAAFVAVAVGIGFMAAGPTAGAVAASNATNLTNQFVFTSGVQIGSTATNRTLINGIIATTCTGVVYASLGATTTAPIDCAVTGALTSAKIVILEPASGQPAAGNLRNLVVWGGHASSTAGYVTANITNLTGAATTSYAQATTSMKVLVIQ